MTTPINRRRFLRGAAAGLGAVTLNQFLTACGANDRRPPQATTVVQRAQPTSLPPTASAATAASTSTSVPTEAPPAVQTDFNSNGFAGSRRGAIG